MSVTLYITGKVSSDFNGYSTLLSLYDKMSQHSNTDITIDFSRCNWFEANLSAALGSIFDAATNNNNSIHVINLKEIIKSILGRNGFLSHFGQPVIEDRFKTTISYHEFSEDKGSGFKEYIQNKLLRKNDFPSLSHLAEKKINESIYELFENARTHGDCEKIHTCGQYFPKKKSSKN